MDFADLSKAFGAFFAIMNPFVNLPVFLARLRGSRWRNNGPWR